MNELQKHKINRKLDTKEKIVIKAQAEKIESLKAEIKDLKQQLYKKVDTIDYYRNKF
tara:strand:- start:1962 stop:2132 length:171 start_codon:yes stop_codon:yes gene_type:complete